MDLQPKTISTSADIYFLPFEPQRTQRKQKNTQKTQIFTVV